MTVDRSRPDSRRGRARRRRVCTLLVLLIGTGLAPVHARSQNAIAEPQSLDDEERIFLPIVVLRESPGRTLHKPDVPVSPTNVYADCTVTEELDETDDGILEQVRVTHYNSASQPVSIRTHRPSGRLTSQIEITYDASNREILRVATSGTGRRTSARVTHRLSNGLPLTIEWDYDGDGGADVRYFHTYADGRLSRVIRESEQEDPSVKSYEYDQTGTLAAIRDDHDGDGVNDDVYSYYWKHGRLDQINSRSFIIPDDYSILYQYNHLGRISKEELDNGSDGSIDEHVDYVYDANGLLELVRYVVNGNIKTVTSFEYDQNSRLVQEVNAGLGFTTRYTMQNDC